jgi:hypothetical protein
MEEPQLIQWQELVLLVPLISFGMELHVRIALRDAALVMMLQHALLVEQILSWIQGIVIV